MSDDEDIIQRLEEVIRARKGESPETSYVASLFAHAPDAIAAKLVEESYELVHVVDSKELPPDAVTHETADVLFHLLVMLEHANVPWNNVLAELERRFGTSGLEEKQNREHHV